MIKVKTLISLLKKNNSNFFTGVPDSVLKELSSSLQSENKKKHVIAINEGAAVSLELVITYQRKNCQQSICKILGYLML